MVARGWSGRDLPQGLLGTLCAFLLVSIAVPILSALACLYLMLNLSVETWIRFGIWLVVGLVVYLGYGHRTARLAGRAVGRATAGTVL